MHTPDILLPYVLESNLAEPPVRRIRTPKDLEKLAYYVHQLVQRLSEVTAQRKLHARVPSLNGNTAAHKSLSSEQAALQTKIAHAASMYLEVPNEIKQLSWYREFDTKTPDALAQNGGRSAQASELAQAARNLSLHGARLIPTLEHQRSSPGPTTF